MRSKIMLLDKKKKKAKYEQVARVFGTMFKLRSKVFHVNSNKKYDT